MNEIGPVRSVVVKVERTEAGTQVVVLPPGFVLPEGEMTIRREGDALIVEPRKTLLEALDQMQPLSAAEWPDLGDDDLGPLRDVAP